MTAVTVTATNAIGKKVGGDVGLRKGAISTQPRHDLITSLAASFLSHSHRPQL
jgi:hypothetical protein